MIFRVLTRIQSDQITVCDQSLTERFAVIFEKIKVIGDIGRNGERTRSRKIKLADLNHGIRFTGRERHTLNSQRAAVQEAQLVEVVACPGPSSIDCEEGAGIQNEIVCRSSNRKVLVRRTRSIQQYIAETEGRALQVAGIVIREVERSTPRFAEGTVHGKRRVGCALHVRCDINGCGWIFSRQ